MARIAIVAMLPIVALLTWRDWVLERQIRLLAGDPRVRTFCNRAKK